MANDAPAASDAQPPKDEMEFVARWVEAIRAATCSKDEKNWRDEAKKAVQAFRGERESKSRQFNLYHSNIEILAPAIFNSVPIPDVRRRYSDKDAVGKFAADIIERGLSYTMDAYDFEDKMKLGVYSMATTGRGVLCVRYEPTVEQDERLKVDAIKSQTLDCEYIQWDRYIEGPAITWGDVPWIAFELFPDRDEVAKLAPGMEKKIPFTHNVQGGDGDKRPTEDVPEAFKRAHLYKIWDKSTRKVIFICPEYAAGPVRVMDDPLGLEDFFPLPRPMHAVAPVGSRTPVCPLTIYRDLLEELNEVTRRISRLVKQLRPRGGYAGKGLDMKAMVEADDGELVPLQGVEEAALMSGQFNINSLIAWFPMEPTVLALRELLAQRDAIKQTIYEVTGIADIMRGASDANETASAQKLKAQFGSVRIRDLQMEVARFARDLLRLKAEIMSKHFEPTVLMEMTGIKMLPQAQKQMLMQQAQANPEQAQQIAQQNPELVDALKAPSLEEVMALLRSSKMRSYRIDIETDSTIRADQMRAQEQMAGFLQGTAQYMAAMGPAVKEGAIPAEAAVEVYAAFARQFQLGKAAEDALDKLAESVQQSAQQKQDPAAGEAAKAQAEGEVKLQIAQMKEQSTQQVKAAEMQADERAKAAEIQAQQQIAALKAQSERENRELTAQLEQMKAQLKIYEIDKKDERERDASAAKVQQQDRAVALNAFTTINKPQPQSRPKA